MFNKKIILITGGTGSFGKAFLYHLLKYYSSKKIIIFSRDEYKQYKLQNEIKLLKSKLKTKVRFLIGDVRDLNRLNVAFKGVDYVVHAAALKHIPIAEYNPIECIRTNITGAENVVFAALAQKVKKVIALSTDKACNPINLYGATKLAADKIFTNANYYRSNHKDTIFSVVRYGNVINSRGSVLNLFHELKTRGAKFLPLTDPKMTRFFITLEQSVKFVLKSFERMKGSEIFVPKLPTIKIIDILKAYNLKPNIIGIRPGEKLHETLCIKDESNQTIEFKDHYVIIPASSISSKNNFKTNKLNEKGKDVSGEFYYDSFSNKEIFDQKKIKEIIFSKKNI